MRFSNLRLAAIAVLLGCALGGCTASSDAAPPLPPLKADFAYEVEAKTVNVTSCPATAIVLRDRSSGRPTSWDWDLPGGAASEEKDLVVRPPVSPGESVTLTIRRGDETDEITKVVNYPSC